MSAQARNSASAAQRLHAMLYAASPRVLSHRHVPPAYVAPHTVSRGMLRRSQCNGPRVPCRMQADRYGWFGSYFGRGFDAVVASELRSLQRVRPRTPEASIGNFHPPRDCSGCRAHSRLRSSACDRRHAPRRGCAACPHAPGSIQQRAACDAPQHGLAADIRVRPALALQHRHHAAAALCDRGQPRLR
jgi:hypothetical protein